MSKHLIFHAAVIIVSIIITVILVLYQMSKVHETTVAPRGSVATTIALSCIANQHEEHA